MRRTRRLRDVFGPPLRDGGGLRVVGPVGERLPALAQREGRDRGSHAGRGDHRAQASLDEVPDPLQRVVERVAVAPGDVADGGEPVELPGDGPLLARDDSPGTRHRPQLGAALGGNLAARQAFGLLADVVPDGGDIEPEQRSDPGRPARPEPDAGQRAGRHREGQRDERVQRHRPEQVAQLSPADHVRAHQQGADAAPVPVAGDYLVPLVDGYPLRADKPGPQVRDRRRLGVGEVTAAEKYHAARIADDLERTGGALLSEQGKLSRNLRSHVYFWCAQSKSLPPPRHAAGSQAAASHHPGPLSPGGRPVRAYNPCGPRHQPGTRNDSDAPRAMRENYFA
jgi:hypothetical protein